MFEPFTRHEVDIGEGISINCVTAGTGPAVLLLHGFPQNLAMWAHVAPKLLEAGFAVVCADLRGYGDSSKPRCLPDKSNYTFRAMARDQVKLMAALGFCLPRSLDVHDLRFSHEYDLSGPHAMRAEGRPTREPEPPS